MMETKLTIVGVPVTAVYSDPSKNESNVYNHESGAVLEFSTQMVKVYKLSWNNRTEIVALTTKNDEESLVEMTWQCFFKALSVQRPEESSSYDSLSKDMYACSFCNVWSQIRTALTVPTVDYSIMDEGDFMDEDENDFLSPEEDWDWYDEADDDFWRK